MHVSGRRCRMESPTGSLTLSSSEDHLSSSTPFLGEFLNESQAVPMLLWQSFTEETPKGNKREFYGTAGKWCLQSSCLGPSWENLRQVATPGILTNGDSRFEKVPSIYFQLRWSGSSGEDGSERTQHVTPASCWVFGSLFIISFIYFY